MKNLIIILTALSLLGCTKKLDLKPDSSLVIPNTSTDFINLLDNTTNMNYTPALAQLSADEYFVPTNQLYLALASVITRNTYLWKADINEGQTKIADWTVPYTTIFYCNSVLDLIDKRSISDVTEKQNIKGWALFSRAYTFYTLASIYSKAYNSATASTDLGIPLKLTSAIEEIAPRSTVQQTYDQIISDASTAIELLKTNIADGKRNRPSKIAAYAFLSRIYLSMRKYDLAEFYADKTLSLYSTLIDYNSLTTTNQSSFTNNSLETIYFTQQLAEFAETTYGPNISYGVNPSLMALYAVNDLRLPVYFSKNSLGNYNIKAINSVDPYPFTGLATDEIFLIKAECLARRQQKDESLSVLNQLLKSRMKTGTFVAVTASNAIEALDLILSERQKSLIWRSVRWTDIKRLNLENRNIILTRTLNGITYSLEPNSSKYVLPIPEDEIALSGVQQNVRF